MVYVAKENQDEGDILTGTRVCTKCGERKPMQAFYFANGKRHRRRKCNTCVEVDRQARWVLHPEARDRNNRNALGSHFRIKYGITVDERDQMLIDQAGTCAICPAVLVTGKGAVTSKAHVDHDHITGKVRGLLCFTCNTALGKFNDDAELLQSAINYLRRNE